MTTWTPLSRFPGYEVSDTGQTRSITRQEPVPFRNPRVLGDSTTDQVVTHPHTEERDSSGGVIPPTRNIGPTLVNVMNFGAVGNGVALDTAAWQAAIDSLPAAGGTVYGPENDYLIDAEVGINLKSKVRILMDPNTRLLAKATSNSVYSIIHAELVNDIEIDGGQVIGERDSHIGTGGEQGHCILILGCQRVTVSNVLLTKGWGDGIKVGGARGNKVQSSDVVGSKIISTQNRRQGLSITNANHTQWFECDFTHTNGTAPQSGVDIEPNAETSTGGTAQDHYFEGCNFDDNASSGIHIQRRTYRVTIKDSSAQRNGHKGFEVVEVHTMLVDGCTIKHNAQLGMTASSESSDVTVSNNVFGQNNGKAARSPALEGSGVVSGTKTFDLSINATASNILFNRYE
jgi:polygalacturonase